MKKILILLTVAFIANFATAQKLLPTDVPANVKAKFDSLYPNTKVTQWEKEKGRYEAMFKKNNSEMSVVIDGRGKLFVTETVIKVSELPDLAKDYIKKNYPTEEIKDAEKAVYGVGRIMYEADVKEGILIFDSKGNFIRKEEGSGSGSGAKDSTKAKKPAVKPVQQK